MKYILSIFIFLLSFSALSQCEFDKIEENIDLSGDTITVVDQFRMWGSSTSNNVLLSEEKTYRIDFYSLSDYHQYNIINDNGMIVYTNHNRKLFRNIYLGTIFYTPTNTGLFRIVSVGQKCSIVMITVLR